MRLTEKRQTMIMIKPSTTKDSSDWANNITRHFEDVDIGFMCDICGKKHIEEAFEPLVSATFMALPKEWITVGNYSGHVCSQRCWLLYQVKRIRNVLLIFKHIKQ